MVEDELFCQRCCLHISASYFSNKYLAWFFDKCKIFYEKYKKKPTINYLSDQLKKLIEEDQQFAYAKVLQKINCQNIEDKQYVIDELQDFVKTSEFKKLHYKTAEYFNSREFENAFDFARNQMNKIDNIKFKNDDYVTDDEIEKILERRGKEDERSINIMGQEFPDYNGNPTWNGKIPRQGVSTIIAPWNTGKTIWSINAAYHAACAGHNVLFIFHEGIKDQIVLKFLSRITGIPYNAIRAGALNEEDNSKIELARKFIKGRIRIKEITKVGNTVEDLWAYCKSVKREFDFDILIDDYAQKLSVKRSLRELRHNYLHIWNTLDQISHELDIAILTAAQINREGSKINKKGGGILRSEHTSETIAPSMVSEVILTLNRSSKDRVKDNLIICLDKGRDALDGLLIECETCFTKMVTHDPKFGMKILGYDTGDSEDD